MSTQWCQSGPPTLIGLSGCAVCAAASSRECLTADRPLGGTVGSGPLVDSRPEGWGGVWSSRAILRTEEGQESAILCVEEGESVCGEELREDSFDHCGDVCETPERTESYVDCVADSGEVSSHTLRDVEMTEVKSVQRPEGTPQECTGPEQELQTPEQACEEAHEMSDSDAFSELGESGNTDVVFVKDDVAVWPSRRSCIMGRLSLVKQHNVLFLAWLPYSRGALNEDGTFQLHHQGKESCISEKEKVWTMYAVHPIPLSDVKAITKYTPTLGYHYLVIILNSGLTLPPLYFNNGGVRSLISALKEHAYLVKSAADPSTYLVNDTADPLQRSLNCLELTDVLLGAPPPGSSTTFHPSALPGNGSSEAGAEQQSWKGASTPLSDGISKIKKLAKGTTSSFFGAGECCEGKDAIPPVAASMPTIKDLRRLKSPNGTRNGQPPPSPQDKHPVNVSGLNRHSTQQKEASTEADTGVGVFEVVDMHLKDEPSATNQFVWSPPVSLEEWGTFFDSEGRLVDLAHFKEKVFYGGVEGGLKKEAWKFLLNYYPADSTAAERQRLSRQKHEEYKTLKQQWASISEAQERRFGKWRERRKRVEKDVCRTDRAHSFFRSEKAASLTVLHNILLTYTMYNFDLGYCQGMSDLASPIVYIMMRDIKPKDEEEWQEAEAEAFWCFASSMDTLEGNFHTDQRGMHAQLVSLKKLLQLLDPQLYSFLEEKDCLNFFFCFRWLLIHFKREFVFDDVLRLWEALWSRHLSDNFHLYMCIAVLMNHRRAIMDGDFDFDALLKFCVELSGNIDLKATMRLAAMLCMHIGSAEKDCLSG